MIKKEYGVYNNKLYVLKNRETNYTLRGWRTFYNLFDLSGSKLDNGKHFCESQTEIELINVLYERLQHYEEVEEYIYQEILNKKVRELEKKYKFLYKVKVETDNFEGGTLYYYGFCKNLIEVDIFPYYTNKRSSKEIYEKLDEEFEQKLKVAYYDYICSCKKSKKN